MDWQTTTPPLDREIEFQTTDGKVRKGQIATKGGELEMFEVRRGLHVSGVG